MKFYQQLRNYPYIRLIFPFIIGIIAGIYLHFPLKPVLFILFLFFLYLIFIDKIHKKFRHRWIFGLGVNIILLMAGLILVRQNFQQHNKYKPLHKEESYCKSYILETPEIKKNTIKLLIKNLCINDSVTKIFPCKVLAYIEKDSQSLILKEGDILIYKAMIHEIDGPKNPYEFNYKQFMAFRGTHYQVFIKNEDWKRIGRKRNIRIISTDIRNKILNLYIQNGIKEHELSLLSAITLGYKQEMSDNLSQSFTAAGAIHVLAVSGLHVGIIYIICNSLLLFITKIKYGKEIRMIIIIAILWMFAFIAGLRPSVVRAAFMFSLIQIGISINRPSNIYNTIAVSAFFILLINPLQITEIGFQLSYLAVTGIVFLQPKLYKILIFKNWIVDKIWTLITISLAAQLSTAPLTIFYFHQFPLYFLLTNIFIIPLVTLIIYLTTLVIFLSIVHFPLGFITNLLQFVLKISIISVQQVEKLPCSLLENINLNFCEMFIIYLIFSSISAYLIKRKSWLFIISLSLLLLFFGFNTMKTVELYKRKKFTVFNIKNCSAFCLVNNKQAILFTDTNNRKRTDLLTKNYLLKNGVINNLKTFTLTDTTLNHFKNSGCFLKRIGKNFIIFSSGFKAFIIRENNFKNINSNKLCVDCIVLLHDVPISINKLIDMFDFKIIILDSSNSYWYRRKWLKQIVASECIIHSVSDNNAFEIRFKNKNLIKKY